MPKICTKNGEASQIAPPNSLRGDSIKVFKILCEIHITTHMKIGENCLNPVKWS